MKRSSLFVLCFSLGSVIAACSAEVKSFPFEPTPTPEGTTPSEDDGGTTKPDEDASPTPQPKPDAGPTKPSAPVFEATIAGKTVKASSVTVTPTGTQGPTSVFYYYTVEATLEETPEIVAGQDGPIKVSIRVAKTENGSDACKRESGTSLREVQIRYSRFTGSQTVIAAPTTNTSGTCSMNILTDSAKGEAWGEATGSVQSGTDEPALPFTFKWFQPVKWP